MPHSVECQERMRQYVPSQATGWCMGPDCTFTREDAPWLWDAMQATYTQGRRDERFFVPDMMMTRQKEDAMTFDVTPDHMRLVQRLYWSWDDSGYEGVPAPGLKRPYGNSYVVGDIAEILGWDLSWRDDDEEMPDEMLDRALKIHREMETVMQIITCTLSCRAGTYRKTETYNSLSWERVEDER